MKCKLVNKDIKNNYTIELLKERGLNEEEINYFLNVPDDSYLEDPVLLDNIDQAYALFKLMANAPKEETITVVVDSDVDGFTSAAIFIQYLRKFNKEVNIIPILHKGKGHGLSDTYEDVLNTYPSYVVLPDAGSNDYEYMEKLIMEREEGDIIPSFLILDHHIVEPDTKFCNRAAIVNNQLSPNYVNKELVGAGVVY